MAAVRAVAALLVVLAAAGAALADGDPRFIPARVASRVRPQTPGQGAAEELKRRSTLPDFTYEPLDWWSDWLRPIKPEAGKKQKTTIWVTNQGDQPVPAGTLLSIWANKTERAKCGETGDVDYKLPELLPAQTAAIKASWKMPTTLGEARVRFFLDSACTVFNESVNNVQWSETTTVLEAGTKYTYLELDDGGTTMWYQWDFEPQNPVRNGTFKATIGVVNLGTEASEAGVKMAVYYDDSFSILNLTECTHAGQVSVDLPKIGPGKVKFVPVEGLKAADDSQTRVKPMLDASCKLGPAPIEPTWSLWGQTTEKAGALLGGVQKKGQVYFTVTTSPKKPKVNATMTVKVKIINMGDADGSVGRVAIFTSFVYQSIYGGYYSGGRCDPTGFAYSFNTTDLVIKAGKSKTVTIKDVPAPSKAGWFGLTVLPDANCANEAEKSVGWQPMPFIAFEVVAP